jgi:hypothetical protein
MHLLSHLALVSDTLHGQTPFAGEGFIPTRKVRQTPGESRDLILDTRMSFFDADQSRHGRWGHLDYRKPIWRRRRASTTKNLQWPIAQ